MVSDYMLLKNFEFVSTIIVLDIVDNNIAVMKICEIITKNFEDKNSVYIVYEVSQ